MKKFEVEITTGNRFSFGENWRKFLKTVSKEQICTAQKSLQKMLDGQSLSQKRFLDAGSGSGIFSLAAKKMGAKVLSFDYDPESVSCTGQLKNKYYRNDQSWQVKEGSLLDSNFLKTLGKFDFIYCWGVAHHTGNMWDAIENLDICAQKGTKIYLAIYNDQGSLSKLWKVIKKGYNLTPNTLKIIYAVLVFFPVECRYFVVSMLKGRPFKYFQDIFSYKGNRGMSWWRDKIDWIGGYPFEVATPDQIFEHFKAKGYSLKGLRTVGGGLACNEYIFLKY